MKTITPLLIRTVQTLDAQSIADIYNYYITHTYITFEQDPVSAQEITTRIEETLAQQLPYLVIEDEQGELLGYAYASKWKGRCAYRFAVEVTIYLSPQATGKGCGFTLYQALFDSLKRLGYHTAIAGISLPNDASVALHKKMGMEQVAHFKQVGYKFEKWIDVGYWQLVFKQAN